MRAIKIDVTNCTVTEVDVSNLKDKQAIVDGYICVGFEYPDGKHVCYVNDEGLLNNPQHFFASKYGYQPYAGNGVIVGSTLTGNDSPCTLTLDEVKASIRFLPLDDVQHLIRVGTVDYGTYITDSTGTRKISSIDLGAFDKKGSDDA
ncbi:hypothetical protein AQUSIP_13140 [Aquicella siphonis]|uniref:DUF3846 domain-containing protein n=1 Tax=Aquicella siphonis TaxID=254247 RepID=A0A5E4PI06_9COXI|nr:DUF3846 domain-containing protein [Aquicella siphonis]VVC76013.1 hypothetical protein AQUSIP_13140 [Aquicella siphonis]